MIEIMNLIMIGGLIIVVSWNVKDIIKLKQSRDKRCGCDNTTTCIHKRFQKYTQEVNNMEDKNGNKRHTKNRREKKYCS